MMTPRKSEQPGTPKRRFPPLPPEPKNPKKYKGGFSNEVFETRQFQEYASGPIVAGYIGSSQRNAERDLYLEMFLEEQGLGPNGIAVWLSSGSGRHLMDSVDEGTLMEEFREQVRSYCKDAFKDVTIWSHPDHTGMMGSTIRLRKKIFGE